MHEKYMHFLLAVIMLNTFEAVEAYQDQRICASVYPACIGICLATMQCCLATCHSMSPSVLMHVLSAAPSLGSPVPHARPRLRGSRPRANLAASPIGFRVLLGPGSLRVARLCKYCDGHCNRCVSVCTPGKTALETLLHEGGHAAHFANVDQHSPFFSQVRAAVRRPSFVVGTRSQQYGPQYSLSTALPVHVHVHVMSHMP